MAFKAIDPPPEISAEVASLENQLAQTKAAGMQGAMFLSGFMAPPMAPVWTKGVDPSTRYGVLSGLARDIRSLGGHFNRDTVRQFLRGSHALPIEELTVADSMAMNAKLPKSYVGKAEWHVNLKNPEIPNHGKTRIEFNPRYVGDIDPYQTPAHETSHVKMATDKSPSAALMRQRFTEAYQGKKPLDETALEDQALFQGHKMMEASKAKFAKAGKRRVAAAESQKHYDDSITEALKLDDATDRAGIIKSANKIIGRMKPGDDYEGFIQDIISRINK